MFRCKEQRLQDVKNGIEVIWPVVSLIKTLAIKEEERDKMAEEIRSMTEDVESVKEAVSSVSSQSMKTDLEGVCNQYNSRLEEAKKALEQQDNQIAELENEVMEYLYYSDSFGYVCDASIVKELLKMATSIKTTKEDFFAITLILLNDAIRNEFLVEEASKMAKDTSDPVRKHILMNIDELEQRDIRRFIKES